MFHFVVIRNAGELQGPAHQAAAAAVVVAPCEPVLIVAALPSQEFPFFTLTCFPPGFLVHVGGVVSARSVKLLDRIHNPGRSYPYIPRVCVCVWNVY